VEPLSSIGTHTGPRTSELIPILHPGESAVATWSPPRSRRSSSEKLLITQAASRERFQLVPVRVKLTGAEAALLPAPVGMGKCRKSEWAYCRPTSRWWMIPTIVADCGISLLPLYSRRPR
jgi:hypothetical protein